MQDPEKDIHALNRLHTTDSYREMHVDMMIRLKYTYVCFLRNVYQQLVYVRKFYMLVSHIDEQETRLEWFLCLHPSKKLNQCSLKHWL